MTVLDLSHVKGNVSPFEERSFRFWESRSEVGLRIVLAFRAFCGGVSFQNGLWQELIMYSFTINL